MRQECDNAQLFALALRVERLLAGQLEDFRGRQVDNSPLFGPGHDVAGSAAAIVILRGALLAGLEIFDGGVALDAITLGQLSMNSSINGA